MSDRPVLLPPPRLVDWGPGRVEAGATGAPTYVPEPGHPAGGYRLRVGEGGVRISSGDAAGAAHARATLDQLRGPDGSLPEVDITDWPDYPVRGVMLDLSRDKVPTMATLEAVVDLMAAWKLNHLQLYCEHTFAYADHADVWADASPLSAAEIRSLDAYCRSRHVELAPNQNSLGHMDRWLAHDRYRPLAIAPDGWQDAFGGHHPPTTMDPARPEALAFIRSLLAELLPNFASRRVNVGLDEPWELPPERAGDYGAYISALRAAPELAGHEMLMWGDIVGLHPELVGGIPEGVTVLEWGYEADHPFAERGGVLADAGLPFWVCPGTSGWNSLLGRWSNARDNCTSAGTAGLELGAGGYLVTDWGDHGHMQPLPVSLPGLAAAAAGAWNAGASGGLSDPDYSAALARDASGLLGAPAGSPEATALAGAVLTLGDAYRAVEPRCVNFSAPLMHLWYPRMRVGQNVTAGLDGAQLDRLEAVLDGALSGLPGAGRPGAGTAEELTLAVDLARLVLADARARLDGTGSLRSVPEETRRALATRADELAERHIEMWTARNRPGGSRDSADRIRHLAACYRRGEADDFLPAWQARP